MTTCRLTSPMDVVLSADAYVPNQPGSGARLITVSPKEWVTSTSSGA